ncbi:hypothetical protein BJ138DRAFT_1162336 [Hygrophoropsis aurantiaca]|uniref:Uncharacterized protein n=1 Tax=Hygrophoropsis aurantiaca TaxID=72124 RepID=A0ACB8A0I8_9AGAM|nr:hypothetical protein BJ138DRAFT_1162336 [Hygrophoropsis aurantiaca]
MQSQSRISSCESLVAAPASAPQEHSECPADIRISQPPAGQTTINTMVVVAMMRFAEYVFVRNMTPWDALLYAFVRDNLALESTSVALIFQPPTQPGTPPTTETRVLARSTHTRLWGLDFYRCANPQCRKDMSQMQAQGQHKAPRWEANTYRLKCFACDHENRNIGIPSWVHPCPGEIQHRVWFNWPPTAEQLADIYAHPRDLAPWL